ncbi:MAG: cell wall hydrolase [Clostridia bacterium]|nr:cell wall hydrolase [Clostridia bacterium]
MKQKIICAVLCFFSVFAMMTPRASASDGDLEILACAIEAVAEGESYTVMASVGAVLVNRLKNESFPASLAAVISDAGIDISGSFPSPRARRAAGDALSGFDPTSGALEYTKVPKEDDHLLLSADGWCFY